MSTQRAQSSPQQYARPSAGQSQPSGMGSGASVSRPNYGSQSSSSRSNYGSQSSSSRGYNQPSSGRVGSGASSSRPSYYGGNTSTIGNGTAVQGNTMGNGARPNTGSTMGSGARPSSPSSPNSPNSGRRPGGNYNPGGSSTIGTGASSPNQPESRRSGTGSYSGPSTYNRGTSTIGNGATPNQGYSIGNGARPNSGNNGRNTGYGNGGNNNNNGGNNNGDNGRRPGYNGGGNGNNGYNNGGGYNNGYDNGGNYGDRGSRGGYHSSWQGGDRHGYYGGGFDGRDGYRGYRGMGRGNWTRPLPPPSRYYYPSYCSFYRPVIPSYYSPYYGAPIIDGVLGLTFGILYDASLDYLTYRGYTIDGYTGNTVYIRNVRELACYWPDATLSYDDYGQLTGAQFSYSTAYDDPSRYNRLYTRLCNTYGSPVSYQNLDNGGFQASWYGGDTRGYVTLSYDYNTTYGGIYRFFTNLYYGY
jgi:hypothetical protein